MLLQRNSLMLQLVAVFPSSIVQRPALFTVLLHYSLDVVLYFRCIAFQSEHYRLNTVHEIKEAALFAGLTF